MSEFNCSCPACGQNIVCDTAHAGQEVACPLCQASIIVPESTTAPAGTAPLPETPPPFTGYDATTAAPRTSALAVASLACSLASLVTCVGWLPGIICGHMARTRMRRDSSLKGKGLAKAGLIIGYSVLMLEVGAAALQIWSISAAVKKGVVNARQELATNNIIVVQTRSPTATKPMAAVVNHPPVPPAAAGWTSNTSTMPFPGQPVSGKVHGIDFTFKTAAFRGVNLRLGSDRGLSMEILGLDQSIEGQNYQIQPADTGANPRIRMTWNDGGVVQTATFSKGYSMKLQFGPANNRRVAGKIYLCLPDDSKSWIAGTFEVRVPKPK